MRLPENIAHAYLILGQDQQAFLELCEKLGEKVNQEPVSLDDTTVLEPAGKAGIISIDSCRDLIHRLSQKPRTSRIKMALILQADRLKPEAQQALLKTLEEPPENSYLFLFSETADAFLPTVLSRIQILKLEEKEEVLTQAQKEFWEEVLDNKERMGKLLEHAEFLALKDKRDLLEDLKAGERYVRDRMIQAIKEEEPTVAFYLKTLEYFWKAQYLLDRNVNARLILENLLINIYSNWRGRI